ncbi:hypothetical protein VNO77_24129 [Canavalia gladiata]|uniref:Uncharacterized protein n=1 Tax=Canavalia gladiata TaxID=3824 RepID=A0AAN9L875_CANGL
MDLSSPKDKPSNALMIFPKIVEENVQAGVVRDIHIVFMTNKINKYDGQVNDITIIFDIVRLQVSNTLHLINPIWIEKFALPNVVGSSELVNQFEFRSHYFQGRERMRRGVIIIEFIGLYIAEGKVNQTQQQAAPCDANFYVSSKLIAKTHSMNFLIGIEITKFLLGVKHYSSEKVSSTQTFPYNLRLDAKRINKASPKEIPRSQSLALD